MGDLFSPVKSFKKGINNAEISGKMLAWALLLQIPFISKTISLIGFSLGA